MGVPGLWEQVEPGVRITSWSQLSEPAFARQNVRGLRVGVDVPIWMFHAKTLGQQIDPDTGLPMNLSPNAALRTLYYRVCKLLGDGILACFVFDGPNRPSFKRDHHVQGNYNPGMVKDLKEMLEVLGMEWRVAAGEAEAELAAMEERGEIDAVLTDDIDTLLFGSPSLLIIRNASKTLSANTSKKAQERTTASQASQGSSSPPLGTPELAGTTFDYPVVKPNHDKAIVAYSNIDIIAETGLGREELILVALLSGADYDTKGSKRFGLTISVALARDGYAKKLFDGIRRIRESDAASAFPRSSQAALERFFGEWRAEVAEALRTNPHNSLKRKEHKLADEFEASTSFPDMSIVDFYLKPAVSDPADPGYVVPTWARRLDITRIVRFSSRMFEWGNVELQAKLRRVLWRGLAMRQIRQSALSDDGEIDLHLSARLLPPDYLKLVTDRKCEASTDFVPSWRLELTFDVFDAHVAGALPPRDPFPFPDLDRMTEVEQSAVLARRKQEGKPSKLPTEPTTSEYRHWIPCTILEACEEGDAVVRAYQDGINRKRLAKEAEEKRKRDRQLARSSPVKKKATFKSPRKARPLPDTPVSDGHSSDFDGYRSRLEAERATKARDDLLAHARKGKAKADSSQTRFSTISPAGYAPSTSGTALHSTGGSTQSTLFSMGLGKSTKSRSLSPLAKFGTVALPTPPSTAPTQRRPARRSSSDSDEVRHVEKASRTSAVTRSPTKPQKRTLIATISISSSDEETSADSDEELEDFLKRRREKAQEGASRKAGSTRAPSRSQRLPRQPRVGDKEVLVLSD